MEIIELHHGQSMHLSHTAVTVGMFDGVHLGHRHILSILLETAREMDLQPWVVTFDRHPQEVLLQANSSRTPVTRLTTNDERASLMQTCGIGHIAILQFTPALADLSACEFLQQVLVGQMGARALVLGYDNMFGSKRHNDFTQLPIEASRLGVNLREAGIVDYGNLHVSSTRIRQALLEGNVQDAAAMLGAPYTLQGRVEQGFHIGRTLGFPTANMELPASGKLIPADGVYAVRVSIDGEGQQLPAMANLGSRPTFDGANRTFEIHLIDHQQDLYGHLLSVQFISRLRDIRKFDSPEALAAQLASDRQETLNLLHA